MTPKRSVTPKLVWSIASVCIGTLLCATAPVSAQSTSSQLSQARKKFTRVKSEYERIGEAFVRAEAAQGQTTIDISRTQAKISRTQGDVAILRGQLRDRIRATYKEGAVGPFDFLLKAQSFREFSLRYFVMQRQSLSDEQTILQLRKKRSELQAQQKELRGRKNTLVAQSADLKRRGGELSVTLEQAKQLVGELQGRLKLEEIQRLFRVSSASLRGNGAIVGMATCPVAGPHFVTNSFGDPRGGGTRRHQGNDIMSPKGTPVVAVVSGTVSTRTGGLGGNAYFLQGNGVSFYYAHLNDFVASEGQHVSAGQLIGHNGNTGDAAGGPDHVHFEIHPGWAGSAAIDPYPSLSRVC
jgi:murein DD-endopeptidase MepM/ murein hydrolase activator NlpD